MLYASTNPRQLRMDIYRAIDRLWASPPTTHTTDVKEALLPSNTC